MMTQQIEWRNLAISFSINDGWYGFTIAICPLDWRLLLQKDEEGIDFQLGCLFVRVIWGIQEG
jgi:hypothetical protein